VGADVQVACFASEWYQSKKISLFSVAEKKGKFHHAAEERKTKTREAEGDKYRI
jgi:hypothetical protein